jgi:hypothetical protein
MKRASSKWDDLPIQETEEMSAASALQAFLLVLASAVNPGALVASAFFLRKERGARLDNAFLIGGLLMSAVVGIVVLALIRLTALQLPKHTTPRYDIRLALGILALIIAAVPSSSWASFTRPITHACHPVRTPSDRSVDPIRV